MNDFIGADAMTFFNSIVLRSQGYFPNLTVKYKDQSWLMKFLSKILFFNPNFMNFTTTIGSTVYLPSESKVRTSPISMSVIFIHELSHIYDTNKSYWVSNIIYLLPQLLVLLAIPALFLIGFKTSLLFLLFLLPFPAYFRMQREKQAYIVSLYVMNKLNKINGYSIKLEDYRDYFVEEFSNSSYYFMWPFSGIKLAFASALLKIQAGEKPFYTSDLYEMVDKVLEG